MALCDRLEEARAARESWRDRLVNATFNCLTAPSSDDKDIAAIRMHTAFTLRSISRLTDQPGHVARVREAVLTLAVRGLLVRQSSRASRQIDTIVDADAPRPPGIDYDLPLSRKWEAVASIATSRLGKILDQTKIKGKSHCYLRNSNVQWYGFDLRDVSKMLFEDSELTEFALQREDVLVCEGGELGRAAV